VSELIHSCNCASQPYVRFACEGVDHYVWGAQTEELPSGVHRSDGGLYSFDETLATCQACRDAEQGAP
jgi:hypothetical protein